MMPRSAQIFPILLVVSAHMVAAFLPPTPALPCTLRAVPSLSHLASPRRATLSTGAGWLGGRKATEMSARELKMDEGEGRSVWDRWWVLPLAPFRNRETSMHEIVKGQVWCLEQKFGALYVHVPIRMTIVKLDDGLLVYGPVAPTLQAVRMVKEIEAEHGAVKHIILASAAIEHKTLAGPFARKFPAAQLWTVPNQYSFPFGLDNLGLLGLTQLFWFLNPKPLPLTEEGTPWEGQMSHAILGPLKSKGGEAPGLFEECVMLHKASRTLLATDVVQAVDPQPPVLLTTDARPLVFHARDDVAAFETDTPQARKEGWERIQLFALFFQPGGVDIVPWGEALPQMATSRMKDLGWNGLFPFAWRPKPGPHPPGKKHYSESISALAAVRGVFCPPVLQKLIFDREPERVLAFADTVARWDFNRVVPAHLRRDVACSPRQWRDAFRFLEDPRGGYPCNLEAPPLCGDARFLEDVSGSLIELGSVGSPDPAVEALREQRRKASGATVSPPSQGGDGWGPFRN